MGISKCRKAISVILSSAMLIMRMPLIGYFDYNGGKITAPPNEYMTQYSFGEITFA